MKSAINRALRTITDLYKALGLVMLRLEKPLNSIIIDIMFGGFLVVLNLRSQETTHFFPYQGGKIKSKVVY